MSITKLLSQLWAAIVLKGSCHDHLAAKTFQAAVWDFLLLISRHSGWYLCCEVGLWLLMWGADVGCGCGVLMRGADVGCWYPMVV